MASGGRVLEGSREWLKASGSGILSSMPARHLRHVGADR